MPQYTCSENNYFFRELGRKVMAGETVELPEEAAARYARSHPGLLKPVRLTTQGGPRTVRRRAPAAARAPRVARAPRKAR
ncbi:MAG TPA: hypothetical protein VD866_30205 [Urbifossiella sp.]|nr:hypothetical protein [Urbifossiella sp.]